MKGQEAFFNFFSNILVFLSDEDANFVDEVGLSYSLGFIVSGYFIGIFCVY